MLLVLIECGYCHKVLKPLDKRIYPRFLVQIYKLCEKNFIKETACRMLIKFYSKKRRNTGAEELHHIEDDSDDESRD